MVHAIVFGYESSQPERKISRDLPAEQGNLHAPSKLFAIVSTLPDWATTSVPDHTLVGDRSHIMHAQPLSQAMCMAPGSPAGDTIPFGISLTLSLVAVAAAISQIRGCFLPGELRPWQLTICCIFLASSSSVFGAMISRFHDGHNLILVLFTFVWPGIYEMEFFYKLFAKAYRVAQKVCIGTMILMFLLAVGLCTWVAVKPNELPQILKPLLFATCGVYTGLLTGNLYFAYRTWKGKAKKDRFLMWMFLANGFVCGLILILTTVLLSMGWAQVISADLVLWILFPTSGALTVRFPVLLWQKESLKSVFGLAGQTELHNRPFNTMADQSTNQNSTASLALPPAVYIFADVEAGMNDI